MQTRSLLTSVIVTLAALAPAHAATMSASSTAPAINDEDIANYGDVTSTDKWFYSTGTDGGARGQSITTGGAAVRLKSITYQVSEGNGAAPTKTYALRVGKIAGTNFTQVHSETATQNFSWTSGQYMTWTFASPVLLEPYTTYGIDVGMTGSTSTWQTGIPYINVTGDDYAGGTSYASGTGGIGTTSISSSIASDRTFHLDIERPLDPVFSLVAPSPADNAADVYASREIVMTFSQNVTAGAGNLTIRNLTDNTDTLLPSNDSRLTYDQNVVRLNPAGLLDWGKSYAIRLDAGFFLGDASAPIPEITDDTTWNFTTIAADPLLSAIAAIKAHVLNTTPLTGPQISAHKTTIDNQRQRFAENTAIINAVFDLIATYDTAKGPLFVSGFANNATSFDRNVTTGTAKNSINPENYHWVIYTVMQHAMDLIYTADNLAKYEATLTNYKFGSHTSFPGPCSPPANPANTHNVQINGSFPVTFGRNTQMWTTPARKPTGTYLAPGTIATVTVPPALVNSGYKIRVGAHAWDLSGRRPVNRLERATRLFAITSTNTRIASPYGGGIYIEVPIGSSAGVVNVTVTGGVRAPYFSAKTFHQTTPTEWTTERSHPAPWADFQSEKFMFQVPRKWIYNMTGTQATQLMVDWDKAMDAINDLMGFDRNRGKETMYCQTDVILRSSVHAPGYPAVNVTSNVNSEVSPAGYAGNYLVRGPATTLTAANIEFHEQGHAYGFPKFGGESESNVNLLQPAMLYRAFGKTIDEAQNGSFGGGNSFITVDTTAIAWMCVFSFSPNEIPMQQLEKQYQHKGHAKWMDIARIYATPSNPNAGWEKLDAYWRSFMLDDANNVPYGTGTDDLLLRLSRAVGKDIRPLFHFWGIHPQNPSALAAALAAENLTPDPAIKAKLLHYKSIVPANNAAFRTFAQSWWGRKPLISGAWEETDHAMQWDETLDADAGPAAASVRPTITTGSMYVEGCAAEIRARVDELVDMYFPTGMTPATMSFTVAPTALSPTTVTMAATTVTAASPPVQYYFENTTNGTNSGWISTPTWTQTGLTTDQSYSYKVKARDVFLTENNESPLSTVNLTSAGDITPPSPDPMTFAIAPAAEDEQSITMTATTATDVNGVEYYFENITNSTNSGWQDSPVYTEINLQPLTSYTYRVRARDKSPGQNATAFSANATASTADLPDETLPVLTGLSPADGSLVSNLATNLVATFDEPVIAASGGITLKNLTDATENVFNIGDPAVTVAGNTLTLNPPTDLLHGKDYAVQISSNAISDLSNNPFAGIIDDTTWSFTAILADPIANTGGPYVVPLLGSLSLNGSASAPSHLQTIVSYEWDLNNDGTFGDVNGATPAAINEAVLTSTWGMNVGTNTIGLRVTDSAAKTATATTTVKIGITLTWDANGATASQTDGAGAWLDANKWWDSGANASWTSGATATFGNGGVGGAVTLASPTTVASLTFNSYITTGYTLGTAGQTITLNNGITKNAGGVAATIISPITLGGAQTWTNNSSNTLNTTGTVNLGTNTLTFAGSGNFSFAVTGTSTISGTGGSIIKNGAGLLTLSAGGTAQNHSYTGTTTINGGTVMLGGGNKSTGNFNLNGGMLTDYFQSTYAWTGSPALGAGNNQIQINGNSGFGGGNGNSTWRIGAAGSTLVWGASGEGSATGFFNPTTLRFLSSADNMGPTTYGQATLDNALDLNGAARTIDVLGASGVNAPVNSRAIISRNITATGGGSLVKTGAGNLALSGTNNYNGGTTINNGMIRFDARASMPASGTVSVASGATLGVAVASSGTTWGGGTGNAGIAGLIGGLGSQAGSTVSFAGNSNLLLNVTGNTTESNNLGNGGATNLTLIKTGTSTLTLSGNNSYSGGTTLIQGALSVGSATALGSGTISFNGGTIQSSDATLRTLSNVIAVNADITVGTTGNLTFSNTGSVALGATRIFTINGGNTTFAQAFSGSGFGITKAGAGTLTLTGTNTYTGTTTLNGGSIVLNNGSVAGSTVSFTSNTSLTILGGSGVSSTWNAGSGDFGALANNYNNIQMLIDGDGSAGSAVLTVNKLLWGRTASNSTITLTDGGQMNVNGEVQIGNPYYNTNGNSNMTIGGGTATSTFTGNAAQAFYIGFGERENSNNNVVTVSSGGVLTSVGNMFVGHVNNQQGNDLASTANRLTVTGTGTASMVSISVGYAQNAGAPPTHPIEKANANVVEVTGGGTLTTTGTNYIGRANAASTESNANTLTVTGTGSSWNAGNQNVLVGFTNNASAVSNNNILTVGAGGTVTNVAALTVGSGTGTETGNQLVVNGSLTATSVTVNNGSTLSGSGSITGAVNVAAAGNVTPGNSAGTLTIHGNLIFTVTSGDVGTLNYDLNTIAASDKIVLPTGTLDIGSGALGLGDFSFTDLGGLQNGTYTLVQTSQPVTGSLAADTIGTLGLATIGLQISGDGTDIELVVSGLTNGNPYETWAGGGAFDADTNGDGVDNGLAWLLGAASPSENALGKLPAVSRNGNMLRLTFRCLKSDKRGGAQIKVQSSNDLGVSDSWTSHEAAVPDADSTVNGVIFDTSADGDFINVIADIPASGAGTFARLKGIQ